MRRWKRTLWTAVVVCSLVPAVRAGSSQAETPGTRKTPRLESNLSLGRVSNGRFGVVKSFRWYVVPNVLAIGLTLDFVADVIPFSLGFAVSAPIRAVTPFVCAGAGGGLDGCSINHYGGGLKVRLGRRFGVIAEYRMYHYTFNVASYPAHRERTSAYYFGAGIAWVY